MASLRSRREILQQACLSGLGLTLSGFADLGRQSAAVADARKLNFVFVLIDDLGWADVGCFGSRFYETPHIDRFAASGVRFTNAYAAAAVCSPTRASIMTGKYPARLHLTDWIPGEGAPAGAPLREPTWRKYLPLEEETIAEALKACGCATASIGKWHLGSPEYYPEHQGFDVNIAGGDTGQPASYFWPYQGKTHTVPGLAERGGRPGEYLTDRLTEEALAFITEHRDQPFFLYLAHYAVHTPLMAKADLLARFEKKRPTDSQKNSTYAAMIQSVDESVGRVLARLDELDLAQRTVVVFFSDNGGLWPQSTCNAPLRAGKGHPYEGGIRVPLIVRGPGLGQAGATCDVPVISNDFFPTLLELAGVPPAQVRQRALDGVSLVSLLTGQSTTLPRAELFWHFPHYRRGCPAPYSAVRAGDWKLIEFQETARVELYDLRRDVGENTNLAANEPARAHDLQARLHAWFAAVGAQMPVPNMRPREEEH